MPATSHCTLCTVMHLYENVVCKYLNVLYGRVFNTRTINYLLV